MRVAQGSKVVFSTTSDDHGAIIMKPDDTSDPATAGTGLPTGQVGFYTLAVADTQLRKLSVTLTGTAPFATPLSEERSGTHIVLMPYEVF